LLEYNLIFIVQKKKNLFFEIFSYYSYEFYIFYAILRSVPVLLAGQGFPSTNPFCLFSPNTASTSFTHFFILFNPNPPK